MRTFILGFALLLTLAAPACAAEGPQGPTEPLAIVSAADGKRHDFKVEIANDRESMARGLMFRTEMADDHGMLFVFPGEGVRGFWMKNTLIPLDIVFIGSDAKVRNIGHGKPQSLETVYSDGPVLHVLELNAGTAERLGIKPGDSVHHKAFGNPLEP